MKKILILVNHDIVIYNFRKELVSRLLLEGYQVFLSSPYGERIEYLKTIGCSYIDTAFERHGKNPFSEFMLMCRYLRIMQHIKPHVVLTYTIKPNIYGGICASFMQIPYFSNITGLGTSIANAGVMQKISCILYRISLRKAQCIFFQNKPNQDFFMKKGIQGKNNILLCGSGVNLEEFHLQPFPKMIKFAFIGRVMKEKGIEEFLECAQVLKNLYPYVELDVFGFCEEEYEERLAIFDKKKIITYHGMVRDIKEHLRDIQCVVLPSYHEGMSNTLLEAASSGRVLIASNIPGCREIIEEKKNGYCCEARDRDSLLQKMNQYIQLPFEKKYKMGLASREIVEKKFDRQKVVEIYLREIQGVLEKR